MKSEQRGKRTSVVEVTNLSQHGFWLLIFERELFLPFERFPWFKDAPIKEILNVEMPSPNHLHWPDLDVDLAVESIENPENFPLISRKLPGRTRRAKGPVSRGSGRGRRSGSPFQ